MGRQAASDRRLLGIVLAAAVFFLVVAALVGGLALCLSLGGDSESAAQEAPAPDPSRAEVDLFAVVPAKVSPPAPADARATAKESPKKPGGGGRAQGATITFMNSVGFGQRFCIIADNSNSMRGANLAHCKEEVLKTLNSLPPDTQFYVIFFNAQPVPMPFDGWLNGGPENVEKVKPWVQELGTVLGTKPVPAFARAMQLKPKPDVIFFMTDGLMAAKTPEWIAAQNRQEPKVVINTIMFARAHPKAAALSKMGSAEKQLRQIAEESGGKYTLYSAAK